MNATTPLTHLSAPSTLRARPGGSPRPQPTLPTEEFRPAEVPSRGGWGMGKVALVMLAGGAALAGCTQAPPVAPIQATTPLPLENPQLMLLPEGVPRIDIYRSTTTNYSTDMDGNTTTSESDDPYTPVGVHLGAGLFQDTNDNLVFVPQLAFGQSVGLTHFQRASLGRETGSRWFKPPVLTREANGDVTITRLGVDRIQSGPESVAQRSGRHVRRQAVRTPNGLELRQWDKTRFEIRQNGNGVEVYQYGRKTHSLTRQDNTIHLQQYNNRPSVITQEGEKITVQPPYGRPEVITRTENGFQVENYRTYRLEYKEGEISSDYRAYTPIVYR